MPSTYRNREGFALATAIVAIILIGLLIAASFFGSIQEYRTGRNTLQQERALAAAEFGQGNALTDFTTETMRQMSKGDIFEASYDLGDGSVANVDITKLNMLTFSVVSEGVAAEGTDLESRRRTGMLIRLEIPELRIQGAVTTSGSTRVAGNQTTSGADQNPTGWDCDETGPLRAGYVNDNAGDVVPAGTCSGGGCITGSPKIATDPLAGDPATYDEFGGISYDSLTTLANVTWIMATTPSLDNIWPSYDGTGACNRLNMKNWGDPLRNAATPGKCESYFPIIHLKGPGTTTLKTGRAQGMLLVDGNLSIAGQFEFYGPIIVKGNLSTSGVGNKIIGGVMAANTGCATTPCNKLEGTSHLQFSRCAILQTLMARARPVLAERAWADMF